MDDDISTLKSIELASLVVELTDGKVRHPLAGLESTVGRDLSNTICIPDPYVSQFHARLVFVGTAFTVEDLGSENKTLVNGKVVTTAARVNYGDEIHFGAVGCRLLAPKAPATQTRSPVTPPRRPPDVVVRTAKLGQRRPVQRPSPTFGIPDDGRSQERLQRFLTGVGVLLFGGAVGLMLRMC